MHYKPTKKMYEIFPGSRELEIVGDKLYFKWGIDGVEHHITVYTVESFLKNNFIK